MSTMTKDEEVICAAVLHDTIEDCSGITWDILKLRFGGRVADMVAQESEDKSLSWEERKGATIKRLRTAPIEVQMIGLADKLSNMRDIDRDYPVLGMSSGAGSGCRVNLHWHGIIKGYVMRWRRILRVWTRTRNIAG